ncbi:hypothetical protein H6P81_007340 [Aristolochia fimbriata]|uniref:ELMO domain-containing protein n=1 Tax=Aristolochia fimbriata TaxID=158543 RepID=A0AAV7F2Q1_ARIFI|nr:hypothetical protein H6P81_007340 [Aristolochia fimbriata]
MDEHGGSFVAVRRISQGLERSSHCHSTSAEVVAGSAAWLGRGLSCVCAQRRDSDARLSFDLTPCQEECLQRLQNRIEVTYDSSKPEHQDALRALWCAAFPGQELHGLISEQWKEMGWQGKDPSTDFRGGGFISLENLLYFAKNYPKAFHDLLRKQDGDRAMWEYPFAVAGVNITFMLIQMLDLQAAKPRTMLGAIFLKLLSENESAFDLLYCITFKLMDQQWLAMHASYMDFNLVMKSTRRQLERELLLEDITRLEDMPSYSLLLSAKVTDLFRKQNPCVIRNLMFPRRVVPQRRLCHLGNDLLPFVFKEMQLWQITVGPINHWRMTLLVTVPQPPNSQTPTPHKSMACTTHSDEPTFSPCNYQLVSKPNKVQKFHAQARRKESTRSPVYASPRSLCSFRKKRADIHNSTSGDPFVTGKKFSIRVG